jgi:hypothetical protein
MTNGMIASANAIASAIMASTGNGGQGEKNADHFGKSMEILMSMLMPGHKVVDDSRIERVKEILAREKDKPLELLPMARPSKKSKR